MLYALQKYLVPVRSALTSPSRAHQVSERPIPRSTAAPHLFAGHCLAIGGLVGGPQARYEPRLVEQTYSLYVGGAGGERPR
jgi:hypothetical protein